MRGPSSSHTAASWRIARIGLDLLGEPLKKALVEFDNDGAWALNYREQGTTMGFNGGFLGLDITDERMIFTERVLLQKGISIEYQVTSFPTDHPNTVRLTLHGILNKKIQIIAVSLGGGTIEIRYVNDFPVRLKGDLYALMIFTSGSSGLSGQLRSNTPSEVDFFSIQKGDIIKYEFTSSFPFPAKLMRYLQNNPLIEEVMIINPIMPVIAGREIELPFSTVMSIKEYAERNNADLGDVGLIYEKCISGYPDVELKEKMEQIIRVVHNSIDTGLSGTWFADRILQQQSDFIVKAEKEGKIKVSVVNRIIENVSALMESKSAMEVVVAFPTAGSCGTVGGLLRAVSEDIGNSREELIKAYFAAGIVGAYFAQGPGFSAEEHGCQVECGAASGMAAAGAVQLMRGSAKQALDAASMAIQNMIGLVCDPVADRVEVPCLGKNISAAVNAYSAALMSVSGFDGVIPLDQVIQTVSNVSKLMPSCLKCTGKGGLAVTPEAFKIKKRLKGLSF